MTDWNAVTSDLKDIAMYFVGCRSNAEPGSEAEKLFTRYIDSIRAAFTLISDAIAEEDDGK